MLFNYEATTVISSESGQTGLVPLPVVTATLAQNRTSIFTTACMEFGTIGLLTAACLMLYSPQFLANLGPSWATSGNIMHVVSQTLTQTLISVIEPTYTIPKMV